MTSSTLSQSDPAANVQHHTVRVRAITPDPFAGLKGHEYIKARNLSKPVQRVQTFEHSPAVKQQEAE